MIVEKSLEHDFNIVDDPQLPDVHKNLSENNLQGMLKLSKLDNNIKLSQLGLTDFTNEKY